MKRAGIRVFLAACAVLLVGMAAIGARGTSAQDGPYLLEINANLCPDAAQYTSTDDCTTPASRVSITALVVALGAENEPIVTDDSGYAVYELDSIRYGIVFTVEIPDGYLYFETHCYGSDGTPITPGPAEDGFSLQNNVPPGNISCGLYFFNLTHVPEPMYSVSAIVSHCSELPEGGPYYASPLCHTPEGVHLSFTTESGVEFYSCDTGPDQPCSAGIPFGETVIITLDESTIPDGDYLYGTANPQSFTAPESPPDGIYGGPFFMLLPVDAAVPSEVPEDIAVQEAEPTTEAPTVEGRTVALYTGDCDNLKEEVATLNDVLPEEGDAVGDENAIPAEMSVTHGAAFFLDEAIDGGHALVVYEDATTDTPVSCGELGGANTRDGVLPIGLAQVDDSGIVGTAILSYNVDDEQTTDVTIVISAHLLPEPSATPGA